MFVPLEKILKIRIQQNPELGAADIFIQIRDKWDKILLHAAKNTPALRTTLVPSGIYEHTLVVRARNSSARAAAGLHTQNIVDAIRVCVPNAHVTHLRFVLGATVQEQSRGILRRGSRIRQKPSR